MEPTEFNLSEELKKIYIGNKDIHKVLTLVNDLFEEFIKRLKDNLCMEMLELGRGCHLDRITQEQIWDTINKLAGDELTK